VICLNLLENVQSQNGENGIKEKALVQNFFLNQCFFFFFFSCSVRLWCVICSSVSLYERYNQDNYWLQNSSFVHCLSCHVRTMTISLPTLGDMLDLRLLHLLTTITWDADGLNWMDSSIIIILKLDWFIKTLIQRQKLLQSYHSREMQISRCITNGTSLYVQKFY